MLVLALVSCSNTEEFAPNPELNPKVNAAAVCSSTWRPTGSMAQQRVAATATRLADGTVLVAGGFGGTSFVADAERYNPATGTWSAAGAFTARYWHRAVGLRDGRVLVVGGFTSSGVTATAEIYDPATNTWSPAASMSTDRYAFQLTALSDGRVLAFGGISGGRPALETAEVYDPLRNVWSSVGSMASPRYLAGAALLRDGRVLVTGGDGPAGYQKSAEIFDPSSGAWSAAPSMATERYAHGIAVLGNGRVLVVGGYIDPDSTDNAEPPNAEIFNPVDNTWSSTANMVQDLRYFSVTLPLADGRVLVAGGGGNDGVLGGAEIFNPATGQWSEFTSMNKERSLAAAAELPDGRILIVGGNGGANAPNTAEIYSPCPRRTACSEPWVDTGSMTESRLAATGVRLEDNTVLVAGGFGGNGSVAGAERYNPDAGTWSHAGNLNVPRYFHRAVQLQDGGGVLVAGGTTDTGLPTETVEIYNTATNSWSDAGSMSTGRFGHQLTVLSDGRLLASGGFGSGTLATAEVYDPQQNRWSSVGDMGSARFNAGAALLNDGRVLVAGGSNDRGVYESSAEIFDPSSGTWSNAASMATGRYSPGMAVLPDGRVLVAGGTQNFPDAEIFDPASNTWSPTGNMWEAPRFFSEMIPLADGRVLVVGGSEDQTARAEIFDTSIGGVWLPVGSMSTPRYLAVSAELPDGRILIAGGYGSAGITAETYKPCPPNQRPVAVCKPAKVVPAGPTCTAAAEDVNDGSYDPDRGPLPLTFSQLPAEGASLGLGASTVTLTASDGFLAGTCSTQITVKDYTPPAITVSVADDAFPTPPQTITCPSQDPVVLECTCPDPQMQDCGGRGAGSGTFTPAFTDNCGPEGEVTCSLSSSLPMPVGSTAQLTCTATDGSGNPTSCNFQVTVADNTAPDTGDSRGYVLWPATSELVEVSLMNCAEIATDMCHGRLHLREHGRIVRVSSDEDENAPGNGDGSTRGDIQFHRQHPWLVLLRAERDTGRDGRVYTVYYEVEDPSGNTAADSCQVFVPVQSGTQAIDSGPRYWVP